MESNERDALRIAALISKYRKETLTEAEEIELTQWMIGNPERRDLFAELTDENKVTHSIDQIRRYDTAKAFDRLKLRIAVPEKKYAITHSLYIKIGAIAASIILVVILFINREGIDDLLHPMHYEHVSTLSGERKIVSLDDGTKIWLSPASTLRYPDRFSGHTRDILLTGEAFLEVAKDRMHPFIIHSGKINTTVLGTSFDLQAYPEERKVSVTLLTGKVSFSDGRNEVILLPNQRAIYEKNNARFQKQDYPDARKMLERREGKLEYNNAPVSEIIADLRRNYKLNIAMEGDVGSCEFYGRINDGEDPESFLRKLCRAIGAEVRKNGNTFIISGGPCQ